MTSSIYGRLSQEDTEASLGNVPFLKANDGGVRREWHDLAQFLQSPYHFTEQTTPAGPRVRPTSQMKWDLVARADTVTSR